MTELYAADPTPRRLGNLYCFWYSSGAKEPRIVIGPDFLYSLIEIGLVNTLFIGGALFPTFHVESLKTITAIGVCLLAL